MTPLEKLKKLENGAAPGPWRVKDLKWVYSDCPCCGEIAECMQFGAAEMPSCYHTELFVALRNLAPELIALWEACTEVYGEPGDDYAQYESHIPSALHALNAKAKEVL